jgi:hypothetical protein
MDSQKSPICSIALEPENESAIKKEEDYDKRNPAAWQSKTV